MSADPGRCFLCSANEWIDFVFLILFTLEMTVKMLASGLIMHPTAYLRIGWCAHLSDTMTRVFFQPF